MLGAWLENEIIKVRYVVLEDERLVSTGMDVQYPTGQERYNLLLPLSVRSSIDIPTANDTCNVFVTL